MSKILIIESINNAESSTTKILLNEFVNEYKKNNPSDQVDFLNTYDVNASALSGTQINSIFAGTDTEIKKYAIDFKEYEKIVFAAPMWNLSIPASLKCYIDYITYSGVTFKYTQTGPLGLLNNPKVLHITSRGGIYSTSPMSEYEMGDRYLRTIMGFLGATNFTTVAVEAMGMLVSDQKQDAINEQVKKLKDLALTF